MDSGTERVRHGRSDDAIKFGGRIYAVVSIDFSYSVDSYLTRSGGGFGVNARECQKSAEFFRADPADKAGWAHGEDY